MEGKCLKGSGRAGPKVPAKAAMRAGGAAWGSRCRAALLPAPGPRARLTLQDDLLERLPLQPVPAPQFLRDVALPAGKVCGAEARRHAERCPGASRPPIRADTGDCRLRRAASGGRTGAGRRNLTSTHRAPLRLAGMIFRSLKEMT